ncbi:MAG: GNAT family N-acetyltransferase [Porcipelethomonas sp.]
MGSTERTNMIVKKAEKDDLPEILELQYLAYQSEAKLFNDPDIPPLKQTISDIEQEYRKGIVLKALDDNGEIIGSVRGYCSGDTVYIGKLIVHPEHQGKGTGTKLLLEMEEVYPDRRYELFTSSRSVKNLALYQKLGYKVFDERQITDELKFVYLEKIK